MKRFIYYFLTITCMLSAACSSEQSTSVQSSTVRVGSSNTISINGLPAATQLIANMDCGAITDQVISANVMINGQPAVRQTEELLKLCQSAVNDSTDSNVEIGE